jgi:hypothetical protein
MSGSQLVRLGGGINAALLASKMNPLKEAII